MSWTDERIDLLQKMWLQGMSASKIASELANGLTRNAVIGKVYRLGLSGRGKSEAAPSGEDKAPHDAACEPDVFPGASPGGEPDASVVRMRPQPAACDDPAPRAAEAPAAEREPFDGAAAFALKPAPFIPPAPAQHHNVVAMAEPVTIMDLREFMCRWPIGDPTQADFRFCGARRTPGGGPYCPCHSTLAYQPQHDRRRQRAQKPA
ncbi:GcrA family cell cycle regulator [Methylocella sp.]|uniref:GcrA family cell cycle regulator n=1 Tax=Methylocella sp. TaxID=1978226 RepID=UPI0037831656